MITLVTTISVIKMVTMVTLVTIDNSHTAQSMKTFSRQFSTLVIEQSGISLDLENK